MRIYVDDLRRFVVTSLQSLGVSREDASTVADVLTAADLGGIESHGCARLRRYIDGIKNGTISATATVCQVAETPTTSVIDARNSLGQPAAVMAIGIAIAKAEAQGLSAVTVRRSNHFGIAGYYARLGALAGMMTIVATNATPQVAPTHGAQAMYGTNPLAIGLPTDAAEPFVFDAATSVVPRGMLERLAYEPEHQVPEGWAVDHDGRPATDLLKILDGLRSRDRHALLPLGGSGERFGGHKGFNLGLIVDLLCGPLSGAQWGRHVYNADGAGIGQFFLCLRIDRLMPLEDFRSGAAMMFDEVRSSRPAAAAPPIRIAGDGERASRYSRLRDGIPLAPDVGAMFRNIADELNVPQPAFADSAHQAQPRRSRSESC